MRVAAKGLLAAALALSAARLAASSGTVFDDRNGNGIRDQGEPGLASVEVSNGADVAVTDGDGNYRIADRPGAAVFVIKPRGWQPPVDGAELPAFSRAARRPRGFCAPRRRRSRTR